TAHAEQAHALEELATDCPVSEYGGGQSEAFGEGSGRPTPVAVENFQMLSNRQRADSLDNQLIGGGSRQGRVNLLNWDGIGMPDGIFPDRESRTERETSEERS